MARWLTVAISFSLAAAHSGVGLFVDGAGTDH